MRFSATLLTVALLIMVVTPRRAPLHAQDPAPADYFPLKVGNHWSYETVFDTSRGGSYDRWTYIDVVDTVTFGIPGETVSYKVEHSECIFGHQDTSTYRVVYYSYNSNGDLGFTAFDMGGTVLILDSLHPYLRNPITVRDSSVLGDLAGHRVVSTVESISDTLNLPLGRFESCVRVRESHSFAGVPIGQDDVVYISSSYCPNAGPGYSSGWHWDSYPDSARYGYSDLAEIKDVCSCPIQLTGDVNLSGDVKSSDIIYLVNYVLKDGTAPLPCPAAGDANCDGAVKTSDIIYLVNYVLKGGLPPCDVCSLIASPWSCP